MTSEEIVKALRQCAKSDCSSCGMCPIFPDRECVEHLVTAAASLIEQLIDENTELREEVNLRGNAVRTYEKKRAEAEAERDALREKVPQWISVEERRPEPGVRVIATDGVFVGEAYGGMLGEWRRYDNCLCWFDVTGQEVTHWMPLPEAPKFADVLRGAPDAPEEGEKA